MKIIDPKQYENAFLNESKISSVFDLFYQERKIEFIEGYSELSDIEQFYTLSALVLSFTDVTMAKKLFLNELAQDLRVLKVLNKPSLEHSSEYKQIFEELSQKYPGYQSYWSSFVSETIDKFLEIAIKIEERIKIKK